MANLNIREADGNIVQTLAEGAGTTNDPKVPGSVSHSHRSSGYGHFHQPTIAASTTDSWIIIDLDDTTNFPHVDTVVAHLDILSAAIDPTTNSAWTINIWTLSDVTASNCTRTMVWSRTGTKATGNRLDEFQRWTPYGPVCDPDKVVTSMTETGYSGYNSATNMKTIYSPGAAVIPPNNGDVILEVIVSGDDIGLEVDFAYHTHDADHPG